jgi:hypothetical protein
LRYVLVIGAFLFLVSTGVTAWLCMNLLKRPENQDVPLNQVPGAMKKFRALQISIIGLVVFGAASALLRTTGVI